jgi:hypothetical protein
MGAAAHGLVMQLARRSTRNRGEVVLHPKRLRASKWQPTAVRTGVPQIATDHQGQS